MSEKRELYIHFSATESFEEINYVLKSVIRAAVTATLEYENFPYPAEVSVTLCSAEHIHNLNKQYRGVDRPTDVLSFPMWEDGFYGEVDIATNAIMLGDIVISTEKAVEQAEEYGHSIFRERCFLAVHSTLHLLGYDHETSEEDELYMNLTQEAVLSSMGLKRK